MQTTETTSTADSFIALLMQHRAMIFRHITIFLPQAADAEEIYQQACLTMWTKWQQGVTPDHFGAWARTIAYNHVRNYLRKRKRLPGLFSDELLERAHAHAMRLDDAPDERMAAMEHCVAALPEHQQGVLREYYRSGVTVEQLGAKLGRPVQGLYKLLQRVRKALLECIRERLHARED